MQPKLLKFVTVHLCELQFNDRFIMVLCINIILGVWAFFFFLTFIFVSGFLVRVRGLEHVVECFFFFFLKIVTL